MRGDRRGAGTRWLASLVLVPLLAGCGRKRIPPRPKVSIVRVAWTGVTIKSAITASILRTLGYRSEEKIVSVPLAFKALSLGMPSSLGMRRAGRRISRTRERGIPQVPRPPCRIPASTR